MKALLEIAAVTLLLVSGGAALAAEDFHILCEGNHEAKREVQVKGNALTVTLEDAAANDYTNLFYLFQAMGKKLPVISAATRFELRLYQSLAQDAFNLKMSDSKILPGFGKGLIDVNSFYKESAPPVRVNVTLREGDKVIDGICIPLKVVQVATSLVEAEVETAHGTTQADTQLGFRLDFESWSLPPPEKRRVFERRGSPYGTCTVLR